MCSESVVLCVSLVVVRNGHPPDGEHTVHVIPHPGIVLGPPWTPILVQECWEESCHWVLRRKREVGGEVPLVSLVVP